MQPINEAAAKECGRIKEKLTLKYPRETDAERAELTALLDLIETAFISGWVSCSNAKEAPLPPLVGAAQVASWPTPEGYLTPDGYLMAGKQNIPEPVLPRTKLPEDTVPVFTVSTVPSIPAKSSNDRIRIVLPKIDPDDPNPWLCAHAYAFGQISRRPHPSLR